MIEIKTFAKPKKTGGSSGSSSSTKYISGVISEAEHAARADKAKRAEVADQANYAGTAASAQNAAYASEAGNLHEDAEILQQYLSLKDTVDPQVVNGMVIFAKGLIAKGLADLMMGAKFGNNAKITELGEAVFGAIKSLDYDNAAEQGFSIEKEKNGKYHAFITNLTIWGKARFHEIEVRKLSYSGGNIYLSGAGSKLIKVVPVKQSVSAGVTTWVETTEDDAECDGWKCYLLADDGTTATMNYWQEGDQVRCQTMGEITPGGTYNDASNKSYWRTIPDGGVSVQNEKIYGTKTETYRDEDGNERTREVHVELYDGQAFAWIVVGKHCGDIDGYDDEFSVGYNGSNPAPLETRDIPSAGDTIVLDGNRHRNGQQEYDKTDRQNVIVLETTGEYAPRIACFANITEYKHTIAKSVNGSKKEVSLSVFETSPRGGTKINSSRFEWISDDGSTINIINYRGDWVDGNTYHKNDQVNHNNAVWVCVANSGVDVKGEPSDDSEYWKKVLVGGKGEKGKDGLSGNGIVPAYTRSEGTPTPPTSTNKNNLDNSWSLTIPSVGDVENVSYGDSSWTDYNDDSGCTWKKSPVTANNSTSACLVTFTTTQANQVVKFVLKAFSEKKYDYIFLSEIDADGVPAKPGFAGSSRAASGNGADLSVIDIVATIGTHTVYVCYDKDGSGNYYGDYGLFRIESTAGIPLWQSNGKEVFTRDDSGAIKSEIESWSEPFKVTGEDGADGEQGESALEIIVTPETLVFDTNDYGLVPSETSKQASISCYRNGVKVTNVSYNKSAEKNCSASVSESNGSATVTISKITSQEVVDTSNNSSTISNTSGYATIQVWDKDTNLYHRVQVKFMVNVAKFTGQMVNTNKRFSNTLSVVSKSVGDKMDKSELTQFKAEIEQTAREISLSVSEKTIGRRNLLVGSAFQRDDNNVEISDGARIEMNSGYHGTNCIHVIDDTDGTPHYPGAFWDGSQGGKSIEITKGKKYIISCWYMTNDVNGHLYLEALYTDKETNAKRKGGPNYLSPSAFTVKKVNEWELFTAVIDTTDAQYNYLAFNFFESCNGNYGRINAWICRPMVEEGDTYNGWTLSEKDYDIIGANLIDNSRTLDAGGNIVVAKGKKTLVGDVYELTASGSDDYNTFYRIKGDAFKLNTDYTISFEVRGDAKYMGAYVSYPATNTKFTCYKEPQNGAMFEATGNGSTVVYVALIEVKELSKQQRVWAHFRFKDRLPGELYFQFPKNAEQTGVTSWNVTITRPKIEVGAVVTEYTERKSDLVDKASLKAAGIVIDSESVTLYGSQVHIKKNKTDISDTVLIDNNTGKVSAGLINADEVVARGIKAQNLEATSLKVTGNSQLGIFEIHTATGDDRDQYTISGDSIQYSGGYKFPDGKTDAYGAGSFLMYKPMFVRQGSPDDNIYMRLGYQFTEWDDCNISGGNKNYFFVGAAARYVCSGDKNSCDRTALPVDLKYSPYYSELKPAAYIYSIKTLQDDPAFAINVQSAGTAGERTAIKTNAAICGVFAPNVITVLNNHTIPYGVGVVLCTNTRTITLTLPENPVEGQTLIIIQKGAGRVNMNPGTKTIYCGGSTRTSTNQFYSGTTGQFNILVYADGAWQLQWIDHKL